jgi:hypothetical protein
MPQATRRRATAQLQPPCARCGGRRSCRSAAEALRRCSGCTTLQAWLERSRKCHAITAALCLACPCGPAAAPRPPSACATREPPRGLANGMAGPTLHVAPVPAHLRLGCAADAASTAGRCARAGGACGGSCALRNQEALALRQQRSGLAGGARRVTCAKPTGVASRTRARLVQPVRRPPDSAHQLPEPRLLSHAASAACRAAHGRMRRFGARAPVRTRCARFGASGAATACKGPACVPCVALACALARG